MWDAQSLLQRGSFPTERNGSGSAKAGWIGNVIDSTQDENLTQLCLRSYCIDLSVPALHPCCNIVRLPGVSSGLCLPPTEGRLPPMRQSLHRRRHDHAHFAIWHRVVRSKKQRAYTNVSSSLILE